jgi:hypothetical protein
MKKSAYIRVLVIGLLIFMPLSGYSIYFLNPLMGTWAITTLITSLFFTLVCLVTLVGFTFRVRANNNEVIFGAFKTSLRQGFLVGLYALAVLGLASINLLTWWDALLLALSLILFEIYFKSSKEISI